MTTTPPHPPTRENTHALVNPDVVRAVPGVAVAVATATPGPFPEAALNGVDPGAQRLLHLNCSCAPDKFCPAATTDNSRVGQKNKKRERETRKKINKRHEQHQTRTEITCKRRGKERAT